MYSEAWKKRFYNYQPYRSIPGFGDDLPALLSDFHGKGFTIREMVALSDAHSFGQAQCFTIRDRIYSSDAGFASTCRCNCPSSGGDANLAPLDLVIIEFTTTTEILEWGDPHRNFCTY